MAFQCLKLLRLARTFPRHINCHTVALQDSVPKRKEYRTENNLTYLEDPDTFGTLGGKKYREDMELEDLGDAKEQQFLQNAPLSNHRLPTRQYADLIKQYVEHKRIKEALDILEVRMLQEDKVKPENYIYNILIGACANVGYTKKAFKLFNDMKRRSLKPTGDTYTCLFNACANSPWPKDGQKNAQNLRNHMIEKGIEPNLTNYHAMIKAFGRSGDLLTAFQIVDEMMSKKIKIRVHTFNHLLQACISNKSNGLRHALVVWRKMLKMREKPNIYSFNLMLKCVKECDLGTKEDVEQLIAITAEQTIHNTRILGVVTKPRIKSIEEHSKVQVADKDHSIIAKVEDISYEIKPADSIINNETDNDPPLINENTVALEFVEKNNKVVPKVEHREIPNLLSRTLQMHQVLALQATETVQDKFAIVGGQDDFLKEMEAWSVKPDIKTFTQMLPLIDETKEAEHRLLESMKSSGVIADIDFYNMLMKKRCLRGDYVDAIEIKELIEQETKKRKRKYGLKKKYHLKKNIMTYGVLAMACNTKEKAECLLFEMKEEQLKVNIEILGTLLKHAAIGHQFDFIAYIMNYVKEEKLKPNKMFIKHLETFYEKCHELIKKGAQGQFHCPPGFGKSFNKFTEGYNKWLQQLDIEDALAVEHPWKQFQETYPETVQHQNMKIKEPRKFYKRDRTFVRYKPRL